MDRELGRLMGEDDRFLQLEVGYVVSFSFFCHAMSLVRRQHKLTVKGNLHARSAYPDPFHNTTWILERRDELEANAGAFRL